MERRKIQQEAIRQAQRLAAIYDPTGARFNVSPVVTLDDGSVITQEQLRRRQERAAEKLAQEEAIRNGVSEQSSNVEKQLQLNNQQDAGKDSAEPQTNKYRSKTQMKKLALYAPRPPPPKPTIPEGTPLFEQEDNWLSLWDLEDEELERRVNREKRRKAAARKALRVKQQTGKPERRMARDEKRRTYRDSKLEWITIKGRVSLQ